MVIWWTMKFLGVFQTDTSSFGQTSWSCWYRTDGRDCWYLWYIHTWYNMLHAYIYIYIQLYTYIYNCIHIYNCIYICMYMYTIIYIYKYIHNMQFYINIQLYIYINIQLYIYIYYTIIYIYIYIYTNSHIYIYVHIHFSLSLCNTFLRCCVARSVEDSFQGVPGPSGSSSLRDPIMTHELYWVLHWG